MEQGEDTMFIKYVASYIWDTKKDVKKEALCYQKTHLESPKCI